MFRRLALVALMTLSACGPLVPAERTAARPQPHAAPRATAMRADDRVCLAALGARQAAFAPVPDRYYGAGCSTIGTVSLTGLQGDAAHFQIANAGPVACPLADTLAAWARYGVDRAAREVLGSPLARIEGMGSYACRSVAGSARMSAHASAEAIDIAGFVLADGRRVRVLDGWSGGTPEEQRFLRIVHASACKRFGTILGPDYNAAHRDHFHLEVPRAAGGRGFCR